MSEKLAEVYEQYDMDIISTKKGRGATVLTTKDGLRILETFRGSVTRLEQEYVLKQLFLKEGCNNLDYLILNKSGSLFTCDKYRQPFVLKQYYEGNECDMHNPSDVVRAVEALAQFHIYGKNVAKEFPAEWKRSRKEKEEKQIADIKQAIADGEELERLSRIYGVSESALREMLKASEQVDENESEEIQIEQNKENEKIEDVFIRHNKELRKIQKFICKVKRKNAFENLFLEVFQHYYEQGVQCVSKLQQMMEQEADSMYQNTMQAHYGICHGAYNHHNVMIGERSEAILHFERFSLGNQLNDLYQFARKAMEKNHFDFDLLEDIFKVYSRYIELTDADYDYMYILFSYPEKFWKIANSYYNTNKAFLSPKFMEKLQTVIAQEKEKENLLRKYSNFL